MRCDNCCSYNVAMLLLLIMLPAADDVNGCWTSRLLPRTMVQMALLLLLLTLVYHVPELAGPGSQTQNTSSLCTWHAAPSSV
jgi:hypothetical protein